MGVTAIIKDGVTINDKNNVEKAVEDSTSLDKEAFLQLLVAQMKYQDPLEPIDNTEYVSQLATFSSLEQMQNMAKTAELQRASNLVGSTVTVVTSDETSSVSNEVTGVVDYVTTSGSTVKISIDGKLYDLDSVTKTYSDEYVAAGEAHDKFNALYKKLPDDINDVTMKNAEEVSELLQKIISFYNGMSEYEKSFIDKSYVTSVNQFVKCLKNYDIEIEGIETDA
ncbi:flagellar basal-body rod modification protein FlgD [Lachnospiraceae bacterium KH1T2]|jgi:flagellar basal-body rod modification protein FlgD|nr:flagellar basal-body rod modification protein FlgD [Lachnospiraceae bacterium KH1T2]